MTIKIDLPPSLEEEIRDEAGRAGMSLEDQACLYLHLGKALLEDGREGAIREAARTFLDDRGGDSNGLTDAVQKSIDRYIDRHRT